MTDQAPRPILRKDYSPPEFLIDDVDLSFELGEEETLVRTRMRVRRNPAVGGSGPLVLSGEELDLRRVAVDGSELAVGEVEVEKETLTLPDVPEEFELETEVSIHPEKNTRLSGLYKSSGNFCTQCEAEGFRNITYFLDRPDVMACYRVRIEADRARYPVLLSNGNRLASGDLPDGRHWVQWEDPYPKPSYLFALVAGDLSCHRGEFQTRSGKRVPLEIWVEPQNVDKCEHALRSLQKAMKWDEEVFGLEYDLELYMIVAVGDFNMGAMENKGLNIFNAKFVLAKPETATDDDYESIEAVIAHEYFHNWTGNRVTCRDWFQLTLKEGLTVFRDQQFTADMTSAAVKRIHDVRVLRTAQFAEDAGPMAHPIRPESYIEMNNFYTVTVYEKGAEVVRLYETLLGKEGFRRGMDLYFERHDGQAVTCDEFRSAMADANEIDLAQFDNWYAQPGTPILRANGEYDEGARRYTLTLSQSMSPNAPAAPGMSGAADGPPPPLPVPVRVGLLGSDGSELEASQGGVRGKSHVLELRQSEQVFAFEDVGSHPVPSLLRGFSAPVILEMERGREELAFLMAHDSDSFNRWDAGQELAKRLLLDLARDHAAGRELSMDAHFVEAFRSVLRAADLDGSLKSLALTLPDERFLGQQMEVIDPDAVHAARSFAVRQLGLAMREDLRTVYDGERAALSAQPYTIDKESIDRRRMQNRALFYLTALQEEETTELASKQFAAADNMTDYQAAFSALIHHDNAARSEAVTGFYARWKDDPLVLDKWFAMQAISSAEGTLERVRELSEHPDFTLKNPNRARSLLGTFAMHNPVRFHAKDGAGYRFLADHVLELDALNPQVASRVVSAFNPWKRYDEGRQAKMCAELERIAAKPELSKDVMEIVGRALSR